MKYYSREVTRREPVNRFGKIGTPLYVEFFKTNSEKFLEEMNKGKRIRFVETSDKALVKKLRSGKINTVYSEKA